MSDTPLSHVPAICALHYIRVLFCCQFSLSVGKEPFAYNTLDLKISHNIVFLSLCYFNQCFLLFVLFFSVPRSGHRQYFI